MMVDEAKVIYVYGLIPTMEIKKANRDKNIQKVRLEEFEGVTAIFDYIDFQLFNIELTLNDAQWVKEKKMYHHEVLTLFQQQFTVIPLKFCTIFTNRKSLEEMIVKHYGELISLCTFLREKEEWNLKVYCNKEKFKHFIMQSNETVKRAQKEIEEILSDRRCLMKKKLNTVIENEIEIEMKQICNDLHEEAVSISIEDFVENVQERDVIQGEEEIAWSSVYLIDRREIDEFIDIIKQHGNAFKEMGFSFKCYGPSPVYHFVDLDIRGTT
ncbi:GvpL/GvpF family gas vesicle protein [Priestia abyssalis]|uniref:GvpL/GvpF family gas vesicle protein n=1 Tax=Priestia abyssalis TaxID=1221450 RepID=UPI001472E72D|nr:GvpL/GvpF family gas vesicle protein [Priestia abyssalis]